MELWARSRLGPEYLVEPNRTECSQHKPEDNNHCTCDSAYRLSILDCVLCSRTTLGQYRLRYHLDCQGDAQWYQDEIIQIAKHRDKVWNQIDRAERIPDDTGHKKLCVPWRLWVPHSQVERECLCLEITRMLFQFFEQRWLLCQIDAQRSESASKSRIRSFELAQNCTVFLC
jgi:hypothetical protein